MNVLKLSEEEEEEEEEEVFKCYEMSYGCKIYDVDL